jgi:hypothetical protein
MQRYIVMHGASYVDPVAALEQGFLGRSWGCPAVRTEIAESMIDALKLGQFIYAYGPGTQKLLPCKKENSVLEHKTTTGFASR